MQLIAGRTVQEYNRCKNRNVKGELGSKAMHRDIEHIDGAGSKARFTTAI